MKQCPFCMAEIANAARKCKHCGEWVEEGGGRQSRSSDVRMTIGPPIEGPTKACPYCGAQIPHSAWTCMYCKSNVIGGRPLAIVLGVMFLAVFAIILFGFMIPGCLSVHRAHEQFLER
jgi:Double zinc ribbon